jgi:hypothetical protein
MASMMDEMQKTLARRRAKVCCTHGPNTIKTPNPKMSSLLVFNRVNGLEIQLVMLVFSTPLVN